MRQAVGRNSCRIVRRRDDLGKNHNDNSINDLKIYLTQYTLSEMTFLEVALRISLKNLACHCERRYDKSN